MELECFPGEVFTTIKKTIKKEIANDNLDLGLAILFSPRSKIADFKLVLRPSKEFSRREFELILQRIYSLITNLDIIECARTVYPNLYFTLKKDHLCRIVCEDILTVGTSFGDCDMGHGRLVNISFPSPNLNKPLHLGHFRNICIGMALCNLLEAANYKITRTCRMSDCGIHICKSMTAYQEWGNGRTPLIDKIKGDHFVGHFYALFESRFSEEYGKWLKENNSERRTETMNDFFNNRSILGRKARQMLSKWEDNDAETSQLWNRMKKWVIDGLKETLSDVGIDMDRYYDKVFYESEIYTLGRRIVLENLAKNICRQREDNSVWIDLSDYGLGHQILLRSDDSPLYTTQNIGNEVYRFEHYPDLDLMISILGNEQKLVFNVLSAILKIFGYSKIANRYHPVIYGMVRLGSRKSMKSRLGSVIYIDTIIKDMINYLERSFSKSANANSPQEIKAISLAILRYFFLAVKTNRDIVFETSSILSARRVKMLCILRTLAQITNTLEDFTESDLFKADYLLSTAEEKGLALKLLEFHEAFRKAIYLYDPYIIAKYIYELASTYDKTYRHESSNSGQESHLAKPELALNMATKIVLEKGLRLLSIKPIPFEDRPCTEGA